MKAILVSALLLISAATFAQKNKSLVATSKPTDRYIASWNFNDHTIGLVAESFKPIHTYKLIVMQKSTHVAFKVTVPDTADIVTVGISPKAITWLNDSTFTIKTKIK